MRGLWFRFKQRLMRSYGNDRLNTLIIIVSLALMILDIFLDLFILWLVWMLLYFWYLFRFFSTNYRARQRELVKYNSLISGIKRRWQDKEHKYLKCPKCSATLRVPRGKGKITVSCPRCGEKKNTKS